jgi:hypothetical protein
MAHSAIDKPGCIRAQPGDGIRNLSVEILDPSFVRYGAHVF